MKTVTSVSLSNSIRAAIVAIATEDGIGNPPNVSATLEKLVSDEVASRRRKSPERWAKIGDAITADLAQTASR